MTLLLIQEELNMCCCSPTVFVIMHMPVSPGVQVMVCCAISCWMCSRTRHSWWCGLSGGVLYKMNTVLLPLNIFISRLFMALLSHGSVRSVTNTLVKHIFLNFSSCSLSNEHLCTTQEFYFLWNLYGSV